MAGTRSEEKECQSWITSIFTRRRTGKGTIYHPYHCYILIGVTIHQLRNLYLPGVRFVIYIYFSWRWGTAGHALRQASVDVFEWIVHVLRSRVINSRSVGTTCKGTFYEQLGRYLNSHGEVQFLVDIHIYAVGNP